MSAREMITVGVLAAVLGGGLVWTIRGIRPVPTLAEVAALAEASRLVEAEAGIRALLRKNPNDAGANLLAAQIALGRVNPSADPFVPDEALAALDYLGRIKTEDGKLAALVFLCRGKAEHHLGRFDEAEASWIEAIRKDPTVPEAGWSLLELYYLEGRPEEASRLALRLHEVEPDRRDRVQLLLELLRQDVQPPAPASLVPWFEPIVARNPAGVRASIALGMACVHIGDFDRGLGVLRKTVEAHPDHPEAWEALLSGLDDAGEIDSLSRALDSLPPSLADAPRIANYRARIAQERGRFAEAATLYRRAFEAAPTDQRLGYRLARVCRQLGETAEAEPLERKHHEAEVANGRARGVYERANADKTLGIAPNPDLYREIADLREAMARPFEALAWHRLVLLDAPADPQSLAAVARLARVSPQDPSR
jgi:tetratricopeptide (TPR) repeat protein